MLCLIPALCLAVSAPIPQPAPQASQEPATGQASPASQPAAETLVNPRSFEKKGQLGKAIEAWRTWARLKPDDPLPYKEVLRLSFLMKKPLPGIEFGEKGLEKHPKDLELNLAMATAHMRLAEMIAGGGRIDRDLRTVLEDAEYQAESALELSPRQREALAVLGMAQFRLGRLEDARATAETLSKEYPKHHGGPLLLGDIAFREYEKARKDSDTKDSELFRLLGIARQAFAEATRRAPSSARAFRRLGDVSFFQGDTPQSLRWYIEGLARDPRKGANGRWLQKQLAPMKLMDLYIKAARRFAELGTKPTKDRSLLLRKAASLAFLIPNWKLCKSLSEEAYKLDPSWKDGLYYFAIANYSIGDMDAALLGMGTYAVQAPERLDATLRSGSRAQGRDLADKLVFLAGKAWRKGQALPSRAMNRALAVYVDDANSWNNYAFLCRETRAYEQSWKAYGKALEKSPRDPRLLNDAAVILQYHLHRDLAKARKMYEQAILEGKRLLRNRTASKAAKKDARQAISDAKGNLKLLKKKPAKKRDK